MSLTNRLRSVHISRSKSPYWTRTTVRPCSVTLRSVSASPKIWESAMLSQRSVHRIRTKPAVYRTRSYRATIIDSSWASNRECWSCATPLTVRRRTSISLWFEYRTASNLAKRSLSCRWVSVVWCGIFFAVQIFQFDLTNRKLSVFYGRNFGTGDFPLLSPYIESNPQFRWKVIDKELSAPSKPHILPSVYVLVAEYISLPTTSRTLIMVPWSIAANFVHSCIVPCCAAHDTQPIMHRTKEVGNKVTKLTAHALYLKRCVHPQQPSIIIPRVWSKGMNNHELTGSEVLGLSII